MEKACPHKSFTRSIPALAVWMFLGMCAFLLYTMLYEPHEPKQPIPIIKTTPPDDSLKIIVDPIQVNENNDDDDDGLDENEHDEVRRDSEKQESERDEDEDEDEDEAQQIVDTDKPEIVISEPPSAPVLLPSNPIKKPPILKPRREVALQTAPPLPSYLAVCVVFQNEAKRIDEWMHFHMLVGIERFYLYNDKSTDTSVEILEDYIVAGWVTLEDSKYLYDAKNERSMTKLNSFKHCLETYGHQTRWMMFLDMNDFAFSPTSDTLSEVLTNYESYPAVVVRGVPFGSSTRVTHPEGLNIENYVYRASLPKNFEESDFPFYVHSIIDPIRTQISPFDFPGVCSSYLLYDGLDVRFKPENPENPVNYLYPVNENFKKFGPRSKGFSHMNILRFNHYQGNYEDFIFKKIYRQTEECEPKYTRFWSQVDLNDVRDETILRFVPQLRYIMGLPAEDTLSEPIDKYPSTNEIHHTFSFKRVFPNTRLTALILSPPSSAGAFIADILNDMNSNTIQKTSIVYNMLRELSSQISDPNQLSLGFDLSTLSPLQRVYFDDLGTAILRKIHFSTQKDFEDLLPKLPEVTKPDPLPLLGYIYDPRLPIFSSMWRDLIGDKKTVCVIVNSDPEMLSAYYKDGYSLPSSSTTSPVSDLLISWEKYTIASLKGCLELPVIIVKEEELIMDPYATLLKFHRDLVVSVSGGNEERLGLSPLDKTFVLSRVSEWCSQHASENLPFCYYVGEKSRQILYGNNVPNSLSDLYHDINFGIAFSDDFGEYDSPTLTKEELNLI